MKLERLRLEQLPGLSEGFVLQGLDAGINLVMAPNAFGKSSLVRALGYLLADPKRGDPPVSLAADFTDGEVAWRVTRTGSRIEWQRNGKPAARPALPDAQELGRYWLSMENLIAANANDARLADELMRDLRGGFDLGAARINLGERHGGRETRELREARDSLLLAEREAERLSADADRLPEIELDIKRARKAEALCRNIETAERLAETVIECTSIEAELERYPPGMEGIASNDSETLDALNGRIESANTDIRDQRRALSEGQGTLEALGLSQAEIARADAALAAALAKLNELHSAREVLGRQQANAARNVARVRATSEALGGGEHLSLNREHLQLAEGFASSLLRRKQEVAEFTTKVELAGEAPDEHLVRQHERGVDALRDWLDVQSPGVAGGGVNSLLAVAFLAAFASLGASALHPTLGMALVGVSLVGIGVAWWRLRTAAKGQDTGFRQVAEQHFAATGLQAPKWDTHNVRTELKSFDAELAQLLAKRSLAEGGDKLRMQLRSAEEALRAKQAEQADLAETIGFDPAMPLSELDRFIRLVKDWDEARLALAQDEAEIVQSKALIDANIRDISNLLRPWDVEMSSDIDALVAEVEAFQERLKAGNEAARSLDQATRDLDRFEADLKHHQDDRAALYRRAGVEDGDKEELARRLGMRQAWLDAKERLEAAKAREAQDLLILEGSPELIDLAKGGGADELAERLEDNRKIAETRDDLVEARTQIMARIEQAETGSSVQTLVTQVASRLADLERKRDEQLTSDATNLLLDQVEQAYTSEHQPQVLREADRLLRQVTAHEFALKLGEQGDFEALDLRQNTVRNLDQLSTGTRMQALLAVRMAWVRHRQEGALTLPMFLDEALTTSDEVRFMEVARTLQALGSSTGTQIVYLSARRGERGLWQAATGEAPHCIDLQAERDKTVTAQAPHFELFPRPEIPRPQGSAEDFADALAVPSIDLHRDAGEIHLFHLLRDDLDLLYRLMELCRVHTIGQAESLLEQAGEGVIDAIWRQRILRRCHIARAWIETWRQGRPRPLSVADIEAAQTFSPAFLSQVQALLDAGEIAGDAARLLGALRSGKVKRLQRKVIDQFDEWLHSQGFVDDRPVLSADERYQSLLRVVKPRDEPALRDTGVCFDSLESGVGRT